ncbi:MAG TPA: hypothetical protein VD993_07970 [Chitinophagaceae bacterium]|nr:hypothetical protein [Chitinophagaceae bacterium]
MYRLTALILTLAIAQFVSAQQFGGHPPSVKWKQLNTDTARIIFPGNLDTPAQRIANLVHVLDRYTNSSIGNRHRKINIVLQPATTISNAYVALGPFRSEFQMTPRQNSFELGSIPWPDNLATHEYRHVQQYNNFNRGLSKAFYVLFGEEGQALANALVVPDWFFEGDAVYNETKVSNQGRGRLPFFFNDYRALWRANKDYSWMKLRNGSLRDFVPDHYHLGYMLTAYGYEKYGADFWKKVSGDAASFKGLFYPWQKAIQRETGLNYQQFRKNALDYFRQQMQNTGKLPADNAKHFLADQEYPYWMDDKRVVYMETSYKRRPRFVIEENGNKKNVRIRDISIDNYFSYRNGRIVYAAFRPDIRWAWRDYSDIKLLDVETGRQHSVTKRQRYFAPDISADGNMIVAVHVDVQGNSALHLLDANGTIKTVVRNPDGLFYTYPKFFDAQQIVSAVRNREGKMSLALTHTGTGRSEFLLPFTWNVIGFPWVEGGTIYFTASDGTTDKLFGWAEGVVFAVTDTSQETGSYQLNTLNGRQVWTQFTSAGYRLMFSDRSARTGRAALTPNSTFNVNTVETDTSNLLANVPDRQLQVKEYSKSFRLFNFHSRRPYISDPDYTFSFVSQNILNTLETELFFNYNTNERYKQVGLSTLYGGWFPYLRLGFTYTFDRLARLRTNSGLVFWNEAETRVGFTIPLNLTAGKNFTRLSFGSDYVFNKRFFKGASKDTFDNRGFGYISGIVNFSNQVQQARQHIYPRLAQTLTLRYQRAVNNLEGNQFLASGSLYLPGFFQTHNLVLDAAFHRRDTLGNVRFSNSFPFSRGYATDNFHRMWKLGANYHFPLIYPDWGFANLVYFLRIRSNVYYDFTRIADYTQNRVLVDLDFRSYGTEIFFDTKWWNQLNVSFGIRYSRLLNRDLERRGPNQWEFILPVNLLSR